MSGKAQHGESTAQRYEQTELPSQSAVSEDWKPLATIIVALLLFYLSMFLHYRPFDIDNPWFLSFSYSSFVEHVYSDQYMNVAFPSGMDGTQFFGKTAAFAQYLVALCAGWNQ